MTQVLKPVVVSDVGAQHGEGPLWHVKDQRLDWTDLQAGRLHRFDPATGRDEVIEVGTPLGSFAARAAGGYVLAVEAGFAFLDPATRRCDLVAPIDYGPGPAVRMNDGKVDPQGRFWAGTMAYNFTARRGALYRLDPDMTVTRMLDGITIANGLDWSSDGRTFYYIDSLDGKAVWEPTELGVDAFDYDGVTGSITNRRPLVRFPNVISGPAAMSVPDGMTLDAAGFLWVAVFGAGEVRRYSPAGALDAVVEMPVACPTSVAFGGDDLGDLYITSMTLEAAVPPEFRRLVAFSKPRPHEGALFRCRPPVPGRAPNLFGG
jgi:sugar lactone lactonase YvrE